MSQPNVSAVVPARDEEATIAHAVESLSVQPEIGEIIVVDDQSSDRTGVILRELAIRMTKLRLLETSRLPEGWTGKNYAAAMGGDAAGGEWLLFADADTQHLLGSTRRALADASEHEAAMVSYSPEQEMCTMWERALIPFIYCRLAEKYSYARINSADLPDAAANGQFLLVRRDAYEAVGGHRAVAGEVLEDVALARRLKRAGFSIYFASGQGIARTRMYRTFGAMWEGWAKNLFPLLGGSWGAVARELFAVVPWFALALIAAGGAGGGRLVGRAVLAFGIAVLAGRHAVYAAELRRNHYAARLILYYLPAVLLYAATLIVSAWKCTRGSVTWKGREYAARSL